MAVKKKKSIIPILAALLALSCAIGGGSYVYFQNQSPDYFVTFDDSKEISSEARVFLSGIEIGRVVSVKPSGTGIAVGIDVAADYRRNLTEASRFFIDSDRKSPRLLVKNIRSSAAPLAPGQIVEGTDSSWQWNIYNYAQSMERFFETGDIRQSRDRVRDQVDVMDRQLDRMKWDELGHDLQQQMKTFRKNLDETLNNREITDFQKELNKKVNETLASLDRVGESRETQDLRDAVENFQRRMLQELTPPDTAATKPVY